MIEEWRDIKDWEGLYQVSNMGRVRSLGKNFIRSDSKPYTRPPRILKQLTYKNGYMKVELTKRGFAKRYYVHRLVAQAFIPNPDNLPEVNHKDENSSNNVSENLEWCSHKYNSNYGTRAERIKKTLKLIHKSVPVEMYDKDGRFIRRFDSIQEASKELHIYGSSITECCRHKRRKTAGGYIWRYE